MRDNEGYIGLCHPLVMNKLWADRKNNTKSLEELIGEADFLGHGKNWENGKLGGELVSKS